MDSHDCDLGMDRPIRAPPVRQRRRRWRRRARCCRSGAGRSISMPRPPAMEQSPDYYPPRLTGMRGSHAGSFEVAHQMRDRRSIDSTPGAHTGETYDLVVVGGGLSGLAPRHYFVKNVGRVRARAGARQPRRLRRPRQAQRVRRRRQDDRAERRHAQHRVAAPLQPAVAAAPRSDRRGHRAYVKTNSRLPGSTTRSD